MNSIRTYEQHCQGAISQTVTHKIKSQIIQCCVSKKLKRKVLESGFDFATLLHTARTYETVDSQLKQMSEPTVYTPRVDTVNALSRNKQSGSGHRDQRQYNNKKYWFCDGEYRRGQCPARGTQCESCGKYNHFSTVYLSNQRVNHLITDPQSDSDSESEFLFSVTDKSTGKSAKQPFVTDKLYDKQVRLLVDTGATVNVIDESTYRQLNSPDLSRVKMRIFPYGSKQ
jgi:hypothetical protein